MDDARAGRAELAQALRFIRLVNRRLGGTAAALGYFKRWSRTWPASSRTAQSSRSARPIRIIDIGCGSADIPLAIAQWAQRSGRHVRITAVDLHPMTVDLAREWIGKRNDIEIIQADALKLMDLFRPGEFDYAHAGMFLHHLNDVQVMTVLRIMDRLTSPAPIDDQEAVQDRPAVRGLIWNDLIRNRFGQAAVRMLTLGAPPLVRHDAIVSVNAGFTKREAIDLAGRAGLERISFRRHLFHRFTLVSTSAIA